MAQAISCEEHHQKALELMERKRFAEAISELNASLQHEESSEKWNDWSVAQAYLGQLDKAQEGFNHALRLDPRNKAATENLSLLLRLTEPAPDPNMVVEQLLAEIQQIPLLDPCLPGEIRDALAKNGADSEYKIRECLKLLRRLPEFALPRALEKLAEMARHDPLSALLLATYKLEALDFDGAIEMFRGAWQMKPSDLFAERQLIRASHERHRLNPGAPDPFAGLEAFLAAHFCDRAWRHMELADTGDIYACCPAILPVVLGNVETHSVEGVNHSPVLRAIRESIHDGSYRYCSKLLCPLIAGRKLAARASIATDSTSAENSKSGQERLRELFPLEAPAYPTKLTLSYDRSCNLACPSCRNDFYMAGTEERIGMDSKFERYVLEAAKKARVVFLDGAGEVFSSRHSRRILSLLSRENYPHLKIRLISNGTLLDRKTWETFDLKGRLEELWISIDAARPETYQVVRRGGDFTRLLANLEFLKELRDHEGETFPIEFHFVVSSMNFRDMPEFVRMGKRFKANRVLFSVLRELGHLSPEAMKRLAIYEPCHPDHEEFLSILRTPELSDPIVFQGSLGALFLPELSSSGPRD